MGLAELSDVFGEEKKLRRSGNENANYPIAGVRDHRNIGMELLSKNQFDEGRSNFTVYSLFGGRYTCFGGYFPVHQHRSLSGAEYLNHQ